MRIEIVGDLDVKVDGKEMPIGRASKDGNITLLKLGPTSLLVIVEQSDGTIQSIYTTHPDNCWQKRHLLPAGTVVKITT